MVKSFKMPNLPCPVCGADCRADKVLREIEARARSTDLLVNALTEILEANKDFRAGMPSDWEGDLLQDACERATSVLDAVGGASRQGERSPPGPMVPWELKCQQEKCTAPECDCPPAMAPADRLPGGGQ